MSAVLFLVVLQSASAGSGIGARCVECHPGIVARYRSSAMANALGPVVSSELGGLPTVRDGDSGFEYRFTVDGVKAAIVEAWRDPDVKHADAKGPDSKDTHSKDTHSNHPEWRDADAKEVGASPLVFAIGAGRKDRSFAARQGDLVWFAPLEAMHDAQSGAWHGSLAPGHAMQPGLRFETPIAPECLRCHTDSPPPADYPGNIAPPPTWTPRGIGCGACHAHADAHADWQALAAQKEPRSGPDPLPPADPADAIASVSTCARCHLQGDAHIAIAAPWHGIPEPATDLLATRAVFVAAHPGDDIGFVSHVQRLVLSRCFQVSNAPNESGQDARPMTCTTCHDPHGVGYDAAGVQRARAGCTLCHPSGDERRADRADPCARPLAERVGSDCVGCHMRTTPVFDLAEVVIHDHDIVRKPAPPSARKPLRSKETVDGELAPFAWPGRARPQWADDAGLWAMAAAAIGNDETALEFAEREPGAVSSRMATYFHTRGAAFEGAGRTERAIAAYEQALELDPAQGETSVNLGALLGRTGETQRALDVLSAAIALHPEAEGALRNRAIVRQQTGDMAGFASDLDAAFRIRPQAAVARTLAQLWRTRGAKDAEQAWAVKARELDPRSLRSR